MLRRRRGLRPGAAIVRAAIVRSAVRDPLLDCDAEAVEVVGQVRAGEAGPVRHHAAPDIDAHRGRNDRPLRRDHRSDCRAHAPVAVGHDGDVAMDERHRRHVIELLPRLVLDGHPVDPSLDQAAVRSLDDLHCRFLVDRRAARARHPMLTAAALSSPATAGGGNRRRPHRPRSPAAAAAASPAPAGRRPRIRSRCR